MYGVILAGGEGTRLRPLTNAINKHLLPIGKQPMIYYPLDNFLAAGIKNIIIVTGGKHAESFTECISKEVKYNGMNISYVYQTEPDGIVGALKLVEPFIKYSWSGPGSDKFIVMLGDNIVDVNDFTRIYSQWNDTTTQDSLVVSAYSSTPHNYGVLRYNKKRRFVENIVEKPKKHISNQIATGIYGFREEVFKRIPDLEKSKRGEYEITDLLNTYIIEDKVLFCETMKIWYDCGESLTDYCKVCFNMSGLRGDQQC